MRRQDVIKTTITRPPPSVFPSTSMAPPSMAPPHGTVSSHPSKVGFIIKIDLVILGFIMVRPGKGLLWKITNVGLFFFASPSSTITHCPFFSSIYLLLSNSISVATPSPFIATNWPPFPRLFLWGEFFFIFFTSALVLVKYINAHHPLFYLSLLGGAVCGMAIVVAETATIVVVKIVLSGCCFFIDAFSQIFHSLSYIPPLVMAGKCTNNPRQN